MEQNPETDKYSKAKIEQPVQQWSEFLQKPGGIFGRELLIRSIWSKKLKILYTLPLNYLYFCIINF